MALQGTLDTFALPDVLRLLAATKKTGRLRITGGRGTGSVWVESGGVCALEATHAPHAIESVDALFELLRFEDGAFTFDADAVHDAPGAPADVERLLDQSEALLHEWRDIESVVPSMDAWVTLRKLLPLTEVSVDQARWTTVVAVGGGATVRRVADELCLSELPVSRAIKDLVEAGLLSIEDAAPAGVAIAAPAIAAPATAAPAPRPLLSSLPAPATSDDVQVDEEPKSVARAGSNARRTRMAAPESDEPERFVPLKLPGHSGPAASYDPVEEPPAENPGAEFPGLANQSADPAVEEADGEPGEMDQQVSSVQPEAADAQRAASQADADGEQEAAPTEVDADGEPADRGLLLKFLSSVKN